MSAIRVLVLSHMYPARKNPVPGIFVHRQVQALLDVGCEIRVVSPITFTPPLFWNKPEQKDRRQTPQSEVIDGISVFYPRYLRLPRKWFHGISCYTLYQGALGLIGSLVREFKPHVLHAYTATPDGYAGLLLQKRYHLPVVCSLLGSDIGVYPNIRPFTRHLTERVLSESDQLVAVSEALKSAAEAMAQPKTDIKVVYMGCDSQAFAFNEKSCKRLKNCLQLPIDSKVLLFLGSIQRAKGVFELLEAFGQLVNAHQNVHLVFVGTGIDSLALAERAFQLGLKNRIHLVGSPPHGDIPGWLSAADVFVLPSHAEGLPVAVLEAMASAKPVIATRVGGIPEAVEEGESGLLVEKGLVAPLAEAIDFLLSNDTIRQKMGNRGREIVKERFTWEKSAKRLHEIYEKIA